MSAPKIPLLVGAFIACLMCFYPPYRCVGKTPQREIALRQEHHLVFFRPQDQFYNTGRSNYSIIYSVNGYRLFGQIILTTLTAASVSTAICATQLK